MPAPPNKKIVEVVVIRVSLHVAKKLMRSGVGPLLLPKTEMDLYAPA